MKRKKRLTSIMIVFLCFFVWIGHAAYAEEEQTIYIDLWESKLFLVENGEVIAEYPIAHGNESSPTPIGHFKVVEKSKEWGSGFGSRWLGLDVPWGKYGIHGTNKPWLIGKNVSSGCIRMRNEDVEDLFEKVKPGTQVHIDGPVTGVGEGYFKNLSLGSKGNLVQLVQQRLKAGGYYHGKVNGIFDESLKSAVEKFQEDHDIPETGGISKREYVLLGLLEK